MPRFRFGVRSIVTYALIAANIAAAFMELPQEQQQWLQGAGLLALGFFFKGDAQPPEGR